jgi:hypothetical protein
MTKVKDEYGFTTIRISTDTRARLTAIGGMGDTYDKIIKRLLDSAAA